MNIAILLYDRFTALDAIGPYEVLSRLPGATRRVRRRPSRARCAPTTACSRSMAERSLAELPAPDIVLVPGGPGEVAQRAGEAVLEWLRAAHETSTWTTSVCTGSLILAAAGLLDGKRATSHWLAIDELRRARRRADARARRVRRQDRHRRRRLGRHRHGARARRDGSPATRSPRRSSSASSTTRSRRSTPARRRRRPPRSSSCCARAAASSRPARRRSAASGRAGAVRGGRRSGGAALAREGAR